MSVSFSWIDPDDKDAGIAITKSDGRVVNLKNTKLFTASSHTFKVIFFGWEYISPHPVSIYCRRWSKSIDSWDKQIKFEIAYTPPSFFDSIEPTIVHPSLPSKGGRRMRLKSRKNSSKKSSHRH